MKIYNSLAEYKKEAKIGDIIALGGNGYLNGLNVRAKTDCYKVYNLESSSGFVSFKPYKSRNGFTTSTEQKIAVIDKKMYNALPIYEN